MNANCAPTRTARWALALLLAGLVLWPPSGMGRASAAEQDAWRLQVRQAAVAAGDRVLLSEIVRTVGSVPPERLAEIGRIELWRSPGYQGRQQAVTREQLDKLLRYYAPELAGACVLPNRLVVQRGGRVFGQAELRKAVVEFLTPRLAAYGGAPELRDMRIPSYIFIPDALGSIQLEAGGDVDPGPISLTILAKGSDGRISHRAAASLFADVWKAVPCASRPISRLEELTPEKVTFMKRNLAHIGPVWNGEGGPYRLTRSLGTGQPLLMDQLESVPMIARGEKVDLVFQGRTIRLAVKAEALDDAEMGETVEVRNMQSNRVVLATVRDSSTVIVR